MDTDASGYKSGTLLPQKQKELEMVVAFYFSLSSSWKKLLYRLKGTLEW